MKLNNVVKTISLGLLMVGGLCIILQPSILPTIESFIKFPTLLPALKSRIFPQVVPAFEPIGESVFTFVVERLTQLVSL